MTATRATPPVHTSLMAYGRREPKLSNAYRTADHQATATGRSIAATRIPRTSRGLVDAPATGRMSMADVVPEQQQASDDEGWDEQERDAHDRDRDQREEVDGDERAIAPPPSPSVARWAIAQV